MTTPVTARAVTTITNQRPDITITKTADVSSYSSVGTVIHYTVVVSNTGNVTLTNIIVNDPLTGLNQTIASLAPGASRTFNPTYTITQNDINRGYLNNTARANYNFGGTPYSESASVQIIS